MPQPWCRSWGRRSLLGFLTSSPGSRDAATSLTRWQQKGRSFFAPNRSTFQGGSLASPTSQLQGKQQYLTILHRITSYILNCHIPLVASQRSTWSDTGATLARHWRNGVDACPWCYQHRGTGRTLAAWLCWGIPKYPKSWHITMDCHDSSFFGTSIMSTSFRWIQLSWKLEDPDPQPYDPLLKCPRDPKGFRCHWLGLNGLSWRNTMEKRDGFILNASIRLDSQLNWIQRLQYGYGSIPINTIFSGMNIHLPAILMFTRGTRFWHTAIL